MGFTTPKTWAFQEGIESSELNIHLRDQLNDLDARLRSLAFTGTQVTRVAAQSVPDASFTAISYTAENFDAGGWFPGSGTTFTVPASAIPASYTTIMLLLIGRARFAANGTGFRRCRFLKNGGTLGAVTVGAVTGDTVDVVVTEFVSAISGDTVTFEAYQNSGGSLNVDQVQVSVVRFAPLS